jgi:hypothetical protein
MSKNQDRNIKIFLVEFISSRLMMTKTKKKNKKQKNPAHKNGEIFKKIK